MKRDMHTETHMPGEGTQKEDGLVQAKKRGLEQSHPSQTSEGINLADSLISDLTLSFQNWETEYFCCLSHSIYGPSLWEPWQTTPSPSSHMVLLT